MRFPTLLTMAAIALLLMAGCSSPVQTTAPATTNQPAPTTTSAPATSSRMAPGSSPTSHGSDSEYPPPSSTVSITGSGSTFVMPLMKAWALQYAHDHPSVQVSYGGGGSGKGINDICGKLVAFAGSDAPLQPADMTRCPGLLQFPETIGPVAIVYNVNGVPDGLHLTGEVLGKIYTGDVTMWNDDAIKALNPGATLPSTLITAVHRSDSSGTTFVFTDYLGHASTTWSNRMGGTPSKSPNWGNTGATMDTGQGNDQVAAKVAGSEGAIGYVDLAYAKQADLHTSAIQNQAGQWMQPTADGAAKAAAAAASSLPAPDGDWSKVSIVDSSATGAYPVSSFTYILVYKSLGSYGGQVSADQMAGLKAFLSWALHGGQDQAGGLYYAPLPASVVTVGDNALGSMTA